MRVDIQSRRKELGLTLEELGKMVGVSKGTVKKWENGFIKNMRRDKILLLANALQVSPLDILDISTPTEALTKKYEKKELSLSKNYSKTIQKLIDISEITNTIILNSDKSVICYKLPSEVLNKIKILIETNKI